MSEESVFCYIKTMKTFFLTLLACLITCSASQAAESTFTVLRLDKNAWIKQADGSTLSASEGQVLKDSDHLTVLKGNKATVALPGQDNVIYIEGPATLKMNREGLQNSTHLKEGKIFCFIEKMDEASTFSVVTPVAVAAVRGTQFQVMTADGRTLIFNYNGIVEIRTRKANGSPSEKFIELNAGEKTVIEQTGETLPESQPMTREEFTVVEEVRDYLFGRIRMETAPAESPAAKKEEKKSEPLDVQSHWE